MDYVISDIHGCATTLAALLARLSLSKSDNLYCVGDYVDRGRDSKGVLDILMVIDAVCLKGNHEDLMLKALDSPDDDDNLARWIVNGGVITLKSFGGEVPEKYVRYIRSMPLIVELPSFYLCHAGIDRNPMKSDPEILLWDRYCDVNLERTGGRRLVCGHTPRSMPEITDGLHRNKIVIDNGCVMGGREEYGNLVALRLDDMKLFVQPNLD